MPLQRRMQASSTLHAEHAAQHAHHTMHSAQLACTLCESLVLGMGCDMMQIARTTRLDTCTCAHGAAAGGSAVRASRARGRWSWRPHGQQAAAGGQRLQPGPLSLPADPSSGKEAPRVPAAVAPGSALCGRCPRPTPPAPQPPGTPPASSDLGLRLGRQALPSSLSIPPFQMALPSWGSRRGPPPPAPPWPPAPRCARRQRGRWPRPRPPPRPAWPACRCPRTRHSGAQTPGVVGRAGWQCQRQRPNQRGRGARIEWRALVLPLRCAGRAGGARRAPVCSLPAGEGAAFTPWPAELPSQRPAPPTPAPRCRVQYSSPPPPACAPLDPPVAALPGHRVGRCRGR
jgi:hypothetical protein